MEGAPRTPSGSPAAGGPFFCQSCANRQIVVGSRQPEHCAGQYLVSTISQMEIPFQACCVCAASAGWTGWANDACDQCKASKARSKTFIQERVRGSDTICYLQPAQETAVVERQTEEMHTTQRAADVLMQSKSRRKSPATLGKLLPISHDRSSPFPNSDSLDTATNQQKLRYRPPSKHSAQGWMRSPAEALPLPSPASQDAVGEAPVTWVKSTDPIVLNRWHPVKISGASSGHATKVNGIFFPVQGMTSERRPVYKREDADSWIEYNGERKRWQVKSGGNRGTGSCWMGTTGNCEEALTIENVTCGWEAWDTSSKRWERQEEVVVTKEKPTQGKVSRDLQEVETEGEHQERQLQIIKAKTMFGMVDDYGDNQKILFLTNDQAQLLVAHSGSLERMMEALEVPQNPQTPNAPKLVINLLESQGFSTPLYDEFHHSQQYPVWLQMSLEEEQSKHQSRQKLDTFMSEVLVPLAAKTNAIVITNAFACDCVLTESFKHVVSMQRMKWKHGKPPFFVVAMSNAMHKLYRNPDPEARWRDVQSHCHAWQAREHKIKAAMATEFGQQWETTSKTCRHDLDPESSMTILFDNVSPRYTRFDGSAFQEFRTHLFRHLASKLPCVGFQTGSVVEEASFGSQFSESLALVASNTPLIFLDMCQRKPVTRARPNCLKWDDRGDIRPLSGQELTCPNLATALKRKTVFDQSEIEAFSLEVGLQRQNNGASGPNVSDGENEFKKPGVEEALQSKTEHSQAECDTVDSIGLHQDSYLQPVFSSLNLRLDHFIKSGPSFFSPSAVLDLEMRDANGSGAACSHGPERLDSKRVLSLKLVEATVTRAQIIQQAKGDFEQMREELRNRGFRRNLLHCNIAWFHDVLTGDANPNTMCAETGHRNDNGRFASMPLHQAIKEHSDMIDSNDVLGLEGSSREQVNEIASFLAECYVQDRQDNSHNRIKCWGEIEACSSEIRALLSSKTLSSLNVHSPIQVQEALLQQVVQIDRVPSKNSIEGLLLIQEAWCEYDVAMHLANWYKWLSKVLFTLQLLLSWALGLTTCLISSPNVLDNSNPANLNGFALTVENSGASIVFALSLMITLVASIDALLNSKARWMQLRSAAGTLESTIYLYRTRCSEFEVDPTDRRTRQPEISLRMFLVKWRSELASQGDLQISAMKKDYPDHVFQHGQKEPKSGVYNTIVRSIIGLFGACRNCSKPIVDSELGLCDDFHSPMQPDKYMEIRLKRWLAFYRQRLPANAHYRTRLKTSLILLSVAASVVSAGGYTTWALLVTITASAFTSWAEFSKHGEKTERYTRAIIEIENLISHWKSLSQFERTTQARISHLILAGEAVISNERLAWRASSAQNPKYHEDDDHDSRIDIGNARQINASRLEARSLGSPSKVHPS